MHLETKQWQLTYFNILKTVKTAQTCILVWDLA